VSAQQQGQGGAPPVANYTNLQVLPRDITVAQMMQVMRGFQADLGVTCEHCHVFFGLGNPMTNLAADDKQPKKTARLMMLAMRDYNARLTPANLGKPATSITPVTCGTCHRGKPIPEYVQPPLQVPPGAGRQGGRGN
jgi:hypothetical protein